MEVSSERFLTGRMDDMNFDIAIFTNLTKDHINNHKTYTNYRDCKGKLFNMIRPGGFAIINNDDENAAYFKKVSNGKVLTYGINNKSDFMATDIVIAPRKLMFKLKTPEDEYVVESPLSGKYNVYNLMAVIMACYASGFDINTIIENITKLTPIKGRADIIDYNGKFKVIIDYAHTANALKNILEFATVLTNGGIITVTGSAGGRDSVKRPEMGRIVTSLSNYVIFTMDDPRFEDPNDIVDQLVSGLDVDVHNYERVIDRRDAIKKALSIAKEGDVVVIAGRGNDTFMPLGDTVVRCNDYEEVYKNLAEEVPLEC
jgi:UDP-N-acetylmuramoyl-L-alanyl-D-glutamate--2,6-diaminopimelate ligase